MANTRQAKKRILVNARKRMRNLAIRSAVKTAFKKAGAAVQARNPDEAKKLVAMAIRSIDKAATKGVIHKNTAARNKSRLMKKFNISLTEVAE